VLEIVSEVCVSILVGFMCLISTRPSTICCVLSPPYRWAGFFWLMVSISGVFFDTKMKFRVAYRAKIF
jgi:hypothetical protein